MLVRFQKLLSVIAMLLAAVLVLTGCGPKQQKNIKQGVGGTGYLTITDDAGRTVVLANKPERIAVLSTSYVELLYAVGGKAVGRPVSKSAKLPAAAVGLPEVGQVTNINLEKLVALQPDFVIGYPGIHEKLVPILENSGIPVVLLKMKTYADVQAKIALFGNIAGTEQQAQQVARELSQNIKLVTDKLPSTQPKRILVLHATTRSVTVELENSIAGNVLAILNLTNVALGSKPLEKDPDTTPYSMEKIVEADPDIILVTTMGELTDIQKRLKDDVESNPAWASLRAVKNQQVFFLPNDLFQLNPGADYDEAITYMAKIVYPEVYGHVR
jgi:iron complex transport system substrate-binding protein